MATTGGEEELRPEGTPNFDINSDYQTTYLKSEYESEEYHELKNMEVDLNDVVTKKILKLDAFITLRPMIAKDLVEGLEVKVNNEKKAKIVRKVNSTTFVVRFNDGNETQVKVDAIEPAVDPIMKLKKAQITELYELCHKAMLEKREHKVDIVYFFHTFTDYFRVNAKYLFACLQPKTQALLVDELSKRTGVTIKDGIKPIFQSPQ